jgi:nitric oxide dioxygenase
LLFGATLNSDMLSDQTISIVKSTAPILAEHGETLTRHFYKRMFANNPEVAPFFNPAHQTRGTQQKALAAAICAYAANIDNLDALGGAVELIAQKHASLQIQAEQYPIVGSNLLGAIGEVLGEGATNEVIQAWGEAYEFLAKILIGREKEIYHQHQLAPNGWTGFKPFRVIRKERESDVITSFYLQSADGSAIPTFKPGQYITVRFPSPCGHTTMRNYSLSDKPGQPWYRISVKRESALDSSVPDGFVSNYLHQNIAVGDSIEVGPACGEFFLDITEHHQRPLVLISGGVGITPVLSILLSALEVMPERPIYFIHAALGGRTHAFRETVRELAARHRNLTIHTRYSEPTAEDRAEEKFDSEGFVDGPLIESIVPTRDADYFFCGPKPFMVNTYQQLLEWGVPGNQVHLEFFGPREELDRNQA